MLSGGCPYTIFGSAWFCKFAAVTVELLVNISYVQLAKSLMSIILQRGAIMFNDRVSSAGERNTQDFKEEAS